MVDRIKRLSVKIPIYEYYDMLKYFETGKLLGKEEYEYEIELDKHKLIIFKFIKCKKFVPTIIFEILVKDKSTGIKEYINGYHFINREYLGDSYQIEYDRFLIYFKFDVDIDNKVNDKDIFTEVMLNRFASITIDIEVGNLLYCSEFRNEWDLIEFSYIALHNIDYTDRNSDNLIDKLEYYGIDNEDILNDINELWFKYFLGKSDSKELNKEIISLLLSQLYNQSLTKIYTDNSTISRKIEEMFIHHLKVMADEVCK